MDKLSVLKKGQLHGEKHVSALILARGGSKGIPLKNISKIGNLTLIANALKEVKDVGFNSVWVSTDSTKIFNVISSDSENIHWRSEDSATDTASSVAATNEFLRFHPEIDAVALIQCTSPFQKKLYIKQALNLLFTGKDCVFSVTRSFKLRWTVEKGKLIPLNFNPSLRPRRQDWNGELVENGMFYLAKKSLINRGLLQNGNCAVVEIPENDSIEIDTPVDLVVANKLYEYHNINNDYKLHCSIPSLYREIFDICSNNGDPIHRDVYECLLKQCKLESNQLKLIWDIAGPPQGVISRTSLYRTLSLVAWAQQGKVLSEKLLENFSGKEYPTPAVSDLTAVKNLKCQLHLKSNPSILGLSYVDITQLDSLTVDLVPEKKGLFLKHSEYVVSSRRFNSKVTRRYNDFFSLNDLLLSRFPYRMIPRLPPKRIVSDSQFLEVRRRALQRWITLICRHPTICHDALISFFLTDQSADFQNRIKDIFRRAPDEFMTSDIAATAKSLLPSHNAEITSRDQIRTLIQVVAQLKFLAEGAIERKNNYGKDSEDLAGLLKTLNSLHIDKTYIGSWPYMQKGFDIISQELHAVANKSQQHASVEQITVSERLGLLLDVLVSHKDLCERLEKGLVNDHQAALSKMLSLKKRKIQGAIRGADTESVEKLEEKMLAQESIISNVELRSEFSLYCVHMETQLVYAYVETLSAILHSLVALRVRSHSELSDIWKRVAIQVQQFLPQEGRTIHEST